jgi:hypothetical protein
MECSLVHDGSAGRVRLARGTAATLVLSAFLLVATAGCGMDRSAKPGTAKAKGAEAAATTKAGAGTSGKSSRAGRAKAAKSATGSGGTSAVRTNYVRLTLKGCVEFDPRWAAIRLGQSLTWHNESGTTVIVHMPTGPFDREEFVVRPGENAITGPARKAGNFPAWSAPAACRGIPRGAQGASPGVTVESGQ